MVLFNIFLKWVFLCKLVAKYSTKQTFHFKREYLGKYLEFFCSVFIIWKTMMWCTIFMICSYLKCIFWSARIEKPTKSQNSDSIRPNESHFFEGTKNKIKNQKRSNSNIHRCVSVTQLSSLETFCALHQKTSFQNFMKMWNFREKI